LKNLRCRTTSKEVATSQRRRIQVTNFQSDFHTVDSEETDDAAKKGPLQRNRDIQPSPPDTKFRVAKVT
ncbi:hypothetical protein AVEN_143827-1, partial [Araneus ventricosus]